MRVLSLGIMDIRGDLEDMERTKRINQKTEKSKENRDIKGTRGNSKKVEGSKEKKEHRSRGFWENKRKKRTNKKIKNSKEIRKSAPLREQHPETFRNSISKYFKQLCTSFWISNGMRMNILIPQKILR